MKLAVSNPCRRRSAIHSAPLTSVLRPGTLLICCALTRMTSKLFSRMLNIGFHYSPVLSLATCVTPQLISQSESANKSAVIVPKERISLGRPSTMIAATTFARNSEVRRPIYNPIYENMTENNIETFINNLHDEENTKLKYVSSNRYFYLIFAIVWDNNIFDWRCISITHTSRYPIKINRTYYYFRWWL